MVDGEQSEESIELEEQHEPAKWNCGDTAVHAKSAREVGDQEKTR
jgi:hypothetical protein